LADPCVDAAHIIDKIEGRRHILHPKPGQVRGRTIHTARLLAPNVIEPLRLDFSLGEISPNVDNGRILTCRLNMLSMRMTRWSMR
jgi:hypothetical protein